MTLFFVAVSFLLGCIFTGRLWRRFWQRTITPLREELKTLTGELWVRGLELGELRWLVAGIRRENRAVTPEGKTHFDSIDDLIEGTKT